MKRAFGLFATLLSGTLIYACPWFHGNPPPPGIAPLVAVLLAIFASFTVGGVYAVITGKLPLLD